MVFLLSACIVDHPFQRSGKPAVYLYAILMKQGLKTLLLKLLLFLVSVCLFFIWIEYEARQIPNSYSQKKKLIESQLDSIKILVLGSSNGYKDVDPAQFTCKGFNFCNSSQTLFYDSRLCLKYIDRLPQLTGVIIIFSHISLHFELTGTPDNWRGYFYYRYFGIRHPSVSLFDPKAFSYTALYSRIAISDFIFQRLDLKNQMGDIQPSGWEKAPLPGDPDIISDSVAFSRLKFHLTLIKQKNLSLNVRYLEEMLSELRKRNIEVYFITPPVSETYYRFINPDLDEENRRIINDLCLKYNVEYFDYFRDRRFTKGDFYDNDHLNYKGAEKFSKILNRDFISGICK